MFIAWPYFSFLGNDNDNDNYIIMSKEKLTRIDSFLFDFMVDVYSTSYVTKATEMDKVLFCRLDIVICQNV